MWRPRAREFQELVQQQPEAPHLALHDLQVVARAVLRPGLLGPIPGHGGDHPADRVERGAQFVSQARGQLAQRGEFLGLSESFARLHFVAVQGGVLDGNRRLAGEQGQQAHVVFRETPRRAGIDVQHPDDVGPGAQRHRQQRAQPLAAGQVGHAVAGFLAHVRRVQRPAGLDDLAGQAGGDFARRLGEIFLAGPFRRRGPQRGFVRVEQQDGRHPRVHQPAGVGDDALQHFVEFEGGRNLRPDREQRFQPFCEALM